MVGQRNGISDVGVTWAGMGRWTRGQLRWHLGRGGCSSRWRLGALGLVAEGKRRLVWFASRGRGTDDSVIQVQVCATSSHVPHAGRGRLERFRWPGAGDVRLAARVRRASGDRQCQQLPWASVPKRRRTRKNRKCPKAGWRGLRGGHWCRCREERRRGLLFWLPCAALAILEVRTCSGPV